ncbi:uncharacterized protein LTR77_006298 [Saxophila tyrrhenica]|uniref:Uncharacterized protein n=1 Tax=Saxophila tyrrhenica TaxID=1690608 RepID=A0AAV9P7I8_9PEZI|nr:hypothetical protein LTR77_006298 [Saxophila tyrrhenica]
MSMVCQPCGRVVPYDPTNTSGLCRECDQYNRASMTVDPRNFLGSQDYYNNGMPTQGYYTNDTPTHEQGFNGMAGNSFTSPPSSLKRKVPDSHFDEEVDAKRVMLPKDLAPNNTLGFLPNVEADPAPYHETSARGALIRRTVSGPNMTGMPTGEGYESDEEDAFVDAEEELAEADEGVNGGEDRDYSASPSGEHAELAEDEREVVELDDDENGSEENDEAGHGTDAEDDTEADLFSSTFGKKASEDVDSEDEDEDEEEDAEQTEAIKKTKGSSPPPACRNTKHIKSRTIDLTSEPTTNFDPADHHPSCPPSAPRIPTPTCPPPPTIPPIDPTKHLSPHLQHTLKFHSRALHHLPRLPLPAHRYWIGVLNPTENPAKKFTSEKQFVWMRGNRKTTVETVWHVYAQATAEEEFVLLVGGGTERPLPGVRMEEVDYCSREEGGKVVVFRAVLKEELGQVLKDGTKMFAGDIPLPRAKDVREGGKGKERGEKKSEAVVIEIDDD